MTGRAVKTQGGRATAPPRDRILEAADTLFERHGIRGVGVEAIAEAAETNKMTLYRHFASKNDLVAAWLAQTIESRATLWAALDDAPDAADPRARIEHFVTVLGEAVDCYGARGCSLMNTLAELPEKDHPARRVLDDYKRETQKRLTAFFRQAGLANPPEAAAEIQMLIDGAKAAMRNGDAKRSRQRLTGMARTILMQRIKA